MDKYEISLWEDYPDLTSNNIPFLNEGKICVIGSNTMTTAARALEPKLVSNVNGTHIFTFRIYYRYKDEITGEEKINPYLPYLINERKVKVLWKKKWYDLIIKKIEEDTQKRSVLCTCEDLFISELSKNGYELEFSSELQNNSGTASELMSKVLEGSGWRPVAEQQKIIQYQEEPVYEVYTKNNFTATKQSLSGNTPVTIPANKLCLLYQSCLDESCINIQFLYSNEEYLTELNDMLVLNGDCYVFTGKVSYSGNQAIILNSNGDIIFEFNINDSYSSDYRAKRLVNSQVTVFDNLLGRYVDVYTKNGNEVYGYETTEYSDPTLVVNLIANSKDFKDTKGWIGDGITWKISPSFTLDSNGQAYYKVDNSSNYIIDEKPLYETKSYLQVPSGQFYNTAFVSNKTYLSPSSNDIKNGVLGGFQTGDKYIFRYKAKGQLRDDAQNTPYLQSGITGNVYNFEISTTGNYTSVGNAYFLQGTKVINDDWVEYTLTCTKACPANQLDQVGLFINVTSLCYIEEIQFFKLAYGIAKYKDKEDDPEPKKSRINPGEISLQSIANVIYRYYNPNHDGVEDPKDLKFLYQGNTKSNEYIPKYNNYEKITSIEESKSNRFNILQSIAEKFECWVRFIINHDETGRILYDDQGLPQKYVQLVEQIGYDTGISFEYGIDLKGIKRTIVSNTIATKAIIIPNENEFSNHGFCTIARSQLNYCRENFILNFDYYIQQGLLNQDIIEADLYKTNNGHLGYYFYLNKWNKKYDALADLINNKQIELTKQKAEYKVQVSNLRAAEEKLTDNISDLLLLAGVDNLADAQKYAETHVNNRKVQSLMGTIGKLRANIRNLSNSVTKLEGSVNVLETYIINTNNEMNELVNSIKLLHEQFFKKYSRFIQEGTWQDQNYVDDDKYYLDALEVAYRSSRPQIQYDISLLRLSGLEDFSSKIFDLGDICYVQDKEFFGYEKDGITPYKQRIIISQLTSFLDTPEKDIIKVQNYKTQFDDLFQRITTATQALQFSEGRFERAAGVVKPDKTLSFSLLQDTFDYNKDLVLNSANQQVTWDNTGITVADETNSALKVKIMAGGIFASSDGGHTWKNALRGDGISTDLLTAGRINTSEIYMYDGDHPSFRWDSQGINAYTTNTIYEKKQDGSVVIHTYPFSKFVRFDQFGLYGYAGTEDFVPEIEDEIWEDSNVRFALTWRGFLLHGESDSAYLEITNEQDQYGNDQITFKMGNSGYITKDGEDIEASIEISTENDILLKTGDIDRVQIGRYKYQRTIDGVPQYYPDTQTPIIDTDYGIFVRDEDGEDIFSVSANGVDSIGGWNLTKDSFYHNVGQYGTVGLYSKGKVWTIDGPIENNPLYRVKHEQVETDEELIITEEIVELEDIDIPDNEPEKINGHKDIYYILAGNKFGVTVDGRIYSTGGRIGGWSIGEDELYSTDSQNRSIMIKSSGTILVADRRDDEGNIISGWAISSNGEALFRNIEADNGTIAGWMFTPTGLYNTESGTTISSDDYNNIDHFTIDTNSLRAQGGLIGGWGLSPSAITSSNGVILGSNGILNLGANGQLIAGNVIIRENEILFKPNANADPIDIGTSYETFVNDHDKLEKVFTQMGLEFNPGDNEVLLFAMAENVNTALSDSQTANSNVAYIREWIGYDANGNLDGSNIELFADNIAISSTNSTTIASALVNINGRLVADSIDANGNVFIAKNLFVNTAKSIYAGSFYEDDGSENPPKLANVTHKHNLSVDSNGNVTMGSAVYGNGTSFNIADTDFFQRAVSAAGGTRTATSLSYVVNDNEETDYSRVNVFYDKGNPNTLSITNAFNIGRNSYTNISKEFTSNDTYTPGTNERWNSVKVNVPVRTATVKWTDSSGNNLSYSNDNDSIRYDSNDHSSLVYYTLTYSDNSKRTSSFWVNTYKAYEAGLNAATNVSITNAVGIIYNSTPIEKEVYIGAANTNYNNGELSGGVAITFSNNVTKNILVKMSTNNVPTGSSASYNKTNQSFYVDEDMYSNGYYYNGTSSKVAITGYITVDGHRIDIDSFDIGAGPIWSNGRNSAPSGISISDIQRVNRYNQWSYTDSSSNVYIFVGTEDGTSSNTQMIDVTDIYNNGHSNGHDEGYNEGHSDGYGEGYSKGYNSAGGSNNMLDLAYNMGYAAHQGGWYESDMDAQRGAESQASSIVDSFMQGWYDAY